MVSSCLRAIWRRGRGVLLQSGGFSFFFWRCRCNPQPLKTWYTNQAASLQAGSSHFQEKRQCTFCPSHLSSGGCLWFRLEIRESSHSAVTVAVAVAPLATTTTLPGVNTSVLLSCTLLHLLLMRIIADSLLRTVTWLLHDYYIVITSLSHDYYIIIMFTIIHYYYPLLHRLPFRIITNSLLRIIASLSLHCFYIVFTSCLHHYYKWEII